MLPLLLQDEHDAAIHAHARRAFPHECCGFLLGRDEDGQRRVVEVLAAENDREAGERHHRFSIAPPVYLRADRAARQRRLEVLGFYHSHPDAPARPSDYDLDHAWPVYSYLIVAVNSAGCQAMTSWVLREDRSAFDRQPLAIAIAPPPEPAPPEPTPPEPTNIRTETTRCP